MLSTFHISNLRALHGYYLSQPALLLDLLKGLPFQFDLKLSSCCPSVTSVVCYHGLALKHTFYLGMRSHYTNLNCCPWVLPFSFADFQKFQILQLHWVAFFSRLNHKLILPAHIPYSLVWTLLLLLAPFMCTSLLKPNCCSFTILLY